MKRRKAYLLGIVGCAAVAFAKPAAAADELGSYLDRLSGLVTAELGRAAENMQVPLENAQKALELLRAKSQGVNPKDRADVSAMLRTVMDWGMRGDPAKPITHIGIGEGGSSVYISMGDYDKRQMIGSPTLRLFYYPGSNRPATAKLVASLGQGMFNERTATGHHGVTLAVNVGGRGRPTVARWAATPFEGGRRGPAWSPGWAATHHREPLTP